MPQPRELIKSQLRRRILSHISDKDLVLYEGKLADEFGVSRTPIRQVIQALAAESLVDVRSGVGTVAPSLLPERRERDLKAYSAIIAACATCAQISSYNMVKVELTTLRMHLETNDQMPPDDLFFDVSTRFIGALSELVDDKILKGTLIACFWRFIRRRIADHDSNFTLVINELIGTLKSIEEAAKSGDSNYILCIASANIDAIIEQCPVSTR